MAWLMVTVGGQERGAQIDVDVLSIGTGASCGIRLDGAGVAEEHCRIVQGDDGYTLEDLGSAAGTLVNGSPVDEVELEDGDVIVIGARTLRFVLEKPQAAGKPVAKPAAAPARPAAASPRPAQAAPRPAEAPPRPAARTGGGAPSGRAGSARRTASARARAVAAGGGGEQRLVRRRLQQDSGLSQGAVWGIVGISVISLAIALYYVLTLQRFDPQPILDEFNQARNENNLATAEERITYLYENTPEDHDLRSFIVEKYNEFKGATQYQADTDRSRRAQDLFDNNLKVFYDRYYVNPSEPQYKTDPTIARYFLQYRLEPWLRRFEGTEYTGQVRVWEQQMKSRLDLSKPFPSEWWDYEFTWSSEDALESYGLCYQLLTEYLAKPDAKYRGEAQQKLDRTLSRARTNYDGYWGARMEEALAKNPPDLRWAQKWWAEADDRIGDIPEFAARLAEAWPRIEAAARKQGVAVKKPVRQD